jgi:hypothetical protein
VSCLIFLEGSLKIVATGFVKLFLLGILLILSEAVGVIVSYYIPKV